MAQQRKQKQPTALADDAPFETVVQRLEAIVEQLEAGELTLESSLAAFEEGVALTRRATRTLDDMERRIEVLTQDGALEPLPEAGDELDGREA